MSATRPAHCQHQHQHRHQRGQHADDGSFAQPPLFPATAPSPAAWLALVVIALYRRALSPLLPPACRFVPSCSEYGYEAVARYGILAGGRLAIWRILRCNPFGGSGYDPVP
jgi:putative membrane protein insertion efficiency factor